jgi:hypothetical protein
MYYRLKSAAARAATLFIALLALAPAAHGQQWTGTSGVDGNWSTVANWNGGAQPANGGTVTFDGSNSVGTVTTNNDLVTSLSNITVSNVPGAAGTNPVSIAGNALTMGSGGITLNGTTAATQDLTFNLGANNLSLSASQTWGINARTLTVNAASIPLSTTTGNTLTLAWTGAGTFVLNGNITDGAAPSAITTTAASTLVANLRFLGNNTYTGGTTLIARGENIQIGSGTAFGTGPVTFAPAPSGSVVTQVQAFGGPQSIANPVTVNFGFNFSGSNNLTFTGPVTFSQGRAITYNGATGTVLDFAGPVTIGTAGAAAGTMLASTTSPAPATATTTMVFDGVLQEATGVTSGLIVSLVNGSGPAFSSVQFNNQNKFSGGISMTGPGATITAGSSSNFGASPPSGPFGTGTVTVNNIATLPRLQAANGAQSVANNFTLTSSLTVQGSNNLTLSGVLSGPGAIQKTGSGILNLTGANLNTGATLATNVTGGTLTANNPTGSATGSSAVTVTGSGTQGTGGTLGGGNAAGTVGFISGSVAISTPTVGATSGGTLSPGNSAGTLTVSGANTWNPLGTYQFDYDASATGIAPVGGSSDLLKGTSTATLNLGNLSAGGQFTINLNPVNSPTSSSTVTYTIADFSAAAGTPITAPPGIVGTDLTPFFHVTGGFQNTSTPIVSLNNGNQVTVSFTPVPEPACVLAACGGLTALATWRRSRRRLIACEA